MFKKGVLVFMGLVLTVSGCSTGASSSDSKTNTSANTAESGDGGLPESIQPIAAEKLVLSKFKGKKVVYASLGQGWALEDQWRNVFSEVFPQLGMEYKQNSADLDPQKLVQNAQSLLNGKPDVLIVHAADTTNLNTLIKQAHAQGVYVLNINLMTSQAVDGYVGGNFTEGEGALARDMAESCKKKGKKKVAIISGFPGDGLSQLAGAAFKTAFSSAGLEVVADQPQSYDATKAHDMAVTVIQQHPDLCGFIGTWDGMMVGAANAVKQAGKAGEMLVYTSDSSDAACKSLTDGSMTKALDYGVGLMGEKIVALVQYFLETGVKPGSTRTVIFPRYRLMDKAAASAPGACYTGKPL
jgi:ribose transport system substrate-binding protein